MPKKKLTKPKEGSRAKLFSFEGVDGKKYKLSLKQKLFCEYYLEFRGNGVDAIIDAGYDVNYKDNKGKDTGNPNRKLAAVMAFENLIKPHICAYITLKLEEYGFTDDNATKQHLFLMNQFADLPSKKGAVDMFYKLKGKYAATRIKFTDDNEDISDEELEEELLKREKLRKSGKKPSPKKKDQPA